MSPERIKNENYSYPADIWSLGLALFECGTGEFPYTANEGPINLMLQFQLIFGAHCLIFKISNTRYLFFFGICYQRRALQGVAKVQGSRVEMTAPPEGFPANKQREVLYTVTLRSERLSSSPKSSSWLMSEHQIKAPARERAPNVGISVRHVRRSYFGKFVRVRLAFMLAMPVGNYTALSTEFTYYSISNQTYDFHVLFEWIMTMHRQI